MNTVKEKKGDFDSLNSAEMSKEQLLFTRDKIVDSHNTVNQRPVHDDFLF